MSTQASLLIRRLLKIVGGAAFLLLFLFNVQVGFNSDVGVDNLNLAQLKISAHMPNALATYNCWRYTYYDCCIVCYEEWAVYPAMCRNGDVAKCPSLCGSGTPGGC